jgi:hypothetical protein
MPDLEVLFDPRKIGGSENPITVSPTVVQVPAGTRQRLRFHLRTAAAGAAAVFDLQPVVLSPGAPVQLEEPVPMGSTSFSLLDENRNDGHFPQRVYCTLWVRYDGRCYPALYPTIVNEPPRRIAEEESGRDEPLKVEARASAGLALLC